MDVANHSSPREPFANTAAFIMKTFLLGVIMIIRVNYSAIRIDDINQTYILQCPAWDNLSSVIRVVSAEVNFRKIHSTFMMDKMGPLSAELVP